MKNKRTIVAFVLAAILVVGGGAAASKLFSVPPARVPAESASVAPKTGAPTPDLDPLAIAAMKARSYQPSTISTVRELGQENGYSARIVTFVSDGLTEYAYWAQPDGAAPAGGWPVIVLVHGYIVPSQYSTVGNAYTTWIGAWARAGFVVVQPDLRGNGNSQGVAVSGHWSPDYTYDVMNLIASLKADAAINSKHIGVVGHSMGGHIALNVAVISPDVAASMFVNGVVGTMYDLFYNWPNSPAPNDQPAAQVQAELSGLTSQYGTPKTNPSFWQSLSAINYTSNIKGPVMINADSADSIVPYSFSKELDKALKGSGKVVILDTYSGNDHQLSGSVNLPLFLSRSTAFWKQTL